MAKSRKTANAGKQEIGAIDPATSGPGAGGRGPGADRWLIVGGGPSAARHNWVPWIREDPNIAVVATNRGCDFCAQAKLRPAAVWLSDPVAVGLWTGLCRRWQPQGTWLITCVQGRDALAAAGLIPEVICPIDMRRKLYAPDAWSAPRFSGMMLLQWVLNAHRPREVILAGCEGYPPEEEALSWRIGEWLQSVVEAFPELRVAVLGEPTYKLAGGRVDYPDAPGH